MRPVGYLQYYANLEFLELAVLILEYEDPRWQCLLHPNLFPSFQLNSPAKFSP